MAKTSLRSGDVVIVDFPFAGGREAKRRPALIVSGAGFHEQRGDYVAAAISSRPVVDVFELSLARWAELGLRRPSKVRLGQFFTLDVLAVRRALGALTGAELAAIRTVLASVFD